MHEYSRIYQGIKYSDIQLQNDVNVLNHTCQENYRNCVQKHARCIDLVSVLKRSMKSLLEK